MHTRTRKAALIAAAIAAFLFVVPALAQSVTVQQAWSRATPKGSKVAGGYLTIVNRGPVPDKLLSATSTAADKIEIHHMTMQDGIMVMRPVEGGLTIPAEGTATLAPGGDHIMFIGLAASFEEGERVPVSLNFEHAGRIDTIFEVGSIGARGPQLEIAATAPAVVPFQTNAAAGKEPFFTHICGTRVMANVTVRPGRKGPVEVLVQLEDSDEKPIAVDGLSVTLANPNKEIAPTTEKAERTGLGSWRVHMSAPASGKWSLSLGIDIRKDDRIDIAAPILIE